jgi:hypothetical protein
LLHNILTDDWEGQVGDGELAGKLANTRLSQLAQANSRISSPVPTSQLALTDGSYNSAALINAQGDRNAGDASHCCGDTRDDFNKYSLSFSSTFFMPLLLLYPFSNQVATTVRSESASYDWNQSRKYEDKILLVCSR